MGARIFFFHDGDIKTDKGSFKIIFSGDSAAKTEGLTALGLQLVPWQWI
jgi:hypothetical protein